jgi:hypothetical protein
MSTPPSEVYAYCIEQSLTHTLESYPFSWPSPPFAPSPSRSPDLSTCFPPLNNPLDDSPIFPETSESALTDFLLHTNPILETYDTRKIRRYRIEQPILPHRAGPDHLRRYGPKSLRQIPPFPKNKLSKEDGMDLPSTEEVIRSIKKDGKLVISTEDAEFLKDMIYKINNPKHHEIILNKVSTPTPQSKIPVLGKELIGSLRGRDCG